MKQGTLLVMCAVLVIATNWLAFANDTQRASPISWEPQPHWIVYPASEEIEAAAKLGMEARRRGKTVEELLKRWSKNVPHADGQITIMIPVARVAEAAYEAEKLHYNPQDRAAAIEKALSENYNTITFRIWLKNKGKAGWLLPVKAKPGDRRALETAAFALSDESGHYFQPLNPHAERRLEGEIAEVGLPFKASAPGLPVSIPLIGKQDRVDFSAQYEVQFSLLDADRRPVISDSTKSINLLIIGARAEKRVEFSLKELHKAASARL